jgi:hypothetical protein
LSGPRLRGWSDANMPVLRYFLYVGGALIALLLVCNAVLPQEPATNSLVSGADRPAIRIHSDQRWPERVVFDTSQTTVAPVTVVKVADPVANSAVTIASPKARVREAFAQLPLSEQIPALAAEDKPAVKPQPQPRHKVAKARPVQQPLAQQPTIRVAQQPHFALFGNTW